ncbi:MAG: hypothetical protein PVH87_24540 [Desulfobacteraceae bacterium]|jgi:hypothetical protein
MGPFKSIAIRYQTGCLIVPLVAAQPRQQVAWATRQQHDIQMDLIRGWHRQALPVAEGQEVSIKSGAAKTPSDLPNKYQRAEPNIQSSA